MLYALAHVNDDVCQLALKGTRADGVDMAAALQQIQGRQKARVKLPEWAAIDAILYPPQLSMEQCSSQHTAQYKARLAASLQSSLFTRVSQLSARLCRLQQARTLNSQLVDITGGFGVDFAYMSKAFTHAVYVERNEALCQLAETNFKTLGLHAQVVCGDGVDYLHAMTDQVDLLFADPARRDDKGGRTYGIGDCTPNLLPLIGEMTAKARHVVLKLSPMLDWRKAMADVGAAHVEQVHIVAVGNECKELLLVLSAEGTSQPLMVCANDGQLFTAPIDFGTLENRMPPACGTPAPGTYLYEPNAALMKSGMFSQLAASYGVQPLAPDSHLFLSIEPVEHFPGRSFVVDLVTTMNKQELRQHILPLRRANISVRNFPLTADKLRARLKLSDGGDNYLFATTLASGHHVLIKARRAFLS